MRYLPLLLVLALSALVFAQVAGHDFLSWDDDVFFYQNPNLQPPTAASLRAVWTGPYAHLYAPVTYTAWWLLARAGGATAANGLWAVPPAVYHVANLVVHLATIALAYLLLLMLTRSPWAAGVGAMLFGLHPLQVEAVAWGSELKDLLGGCFGLLALLLYVRARTGGTPVGGVPVGCADTSPSSSPPWTSSGAATYALATLAFVLAVLSKPNLVAVPLVALAVDWLLLRTPPRRVLVRVVPWLALAAVHAFLTRAVQPPSPLLTLPLWLRLFVAGDALAFYLAKLVWPLKLAADYGRTPQAVIGHWWGYATWLAPAALLVLAVVLRRRSRWALPGLLWFGFALLPVLGLLPFDFQQYSTPADHYAYLAMCGPALALAGLALHLRGFYGRLPVLVLLALLAAQSGLQTMTWQTNDTFWRHTLEVNPRSYLAHNNLGAVYLLAGRLPLAAREFRAAIELQPTDADALVNLGMVLLRMGQPQEARDALERGLQVRPGDPKAHLMLGMIALQAHDYPTALEHLQTAVAADPQNPAARAELARALRALGRDDEAQSVLGGGP
ncbi:tetratricopeptide repeat protein [bacterium]|nr:tetratricopeptide repeat protein [bacterium]